MSVTVNTYNPVMPRWTPNTRERLAQAAMQLYLQRGYDHTTVTEIATHAGTTERTFYRHFTDKSEVLFGPSTEFQDTIVNALKQTPPDSNPLEAVISALEAAQLYFQGDLKPFQQRQNLIDHQPELASRELHKMATLSRALSSTLQERGLNQLTAQITAETGVSILKIAFRQWLSGLDPNWTQCVRQTQAALKEVISG